MPHAFRGTVLYARGVSLDACFDALNRNNPRLVQAVPVLGSVGPLGKYLAPLGAVTRDEARAAFREQADAPGRPAARGSTACDRNDGGARR